MKNMIRGEFRVISSSGLYIELEKKDTGERYHLKLYSNMDKNLFQKDYKITGRIHAFDDYYRPCGAFNVIPTPKFLFPDTEDLMAWFEEEQIESIQSRILSNNKTITSLLKNYPSHWIHALCELYNLKAGKKEERIKLIAVRLQEDNSVILKDLSEDSKYVLKLILKEGGLVKYSKLRRYDDEINLWWFEHGIPKSSIGALIGRGLLFIGKMQFNDGKMYKIALIPLEIRKKLNQLLFNQSEL